MLKERDKRLDVMRSMALIGIVVAHVYPPIFILQIRNFDVPMMALLMGTSFYLSSRYKKIHYFSYLIKRIKRLVIPTWKFLISFFLLFWLISFISSESYYFNTAEIVRTFALFDGIGYVWIIQVYVGIAVFNPLILTISKKIESNMNYLIILAFTYLVYVVFIMGLKVLSNPFSIFYEHIVLYTVGYGIVAALGMRIKMLNKKELTLIGVFFFTIWLALAWINNFAITNISKYPPTLYYLSYSLWVSFSVYLLLDIKQVFVLFDNKWVYFCSKNSFWIYLWHIMPVFLIELFGESMTIINYNFITRFIFVFGTACILTNIQNKNNEKVENMKKIELGK